MSDSSQCSVNACVLVPVSPSFLKLSLSGLLVVHTKLDITPERSPLGAFGPSGHSHLLFPFLHPTFLVQWTCFSFWEGWHCQSAIHLSSLLASSMPDFSPIFLLVFLFFFTDNFEISGSFPLGNSWTSLEIDWFSSLKKDICVNKYYFPYLSRRHTTLGLHNSC